MIRIEAEVEAGARLWLEIRGEWRLVREWSWERVRLRWRVRFTGDRDGVAAGC